MPLIIGLPRGTWSLSDGGEWSCDIGLSRPFAELVGAFVDSFSPVAAVRALSWGSLSEGEDAVEANVGTTGPLRGSDIVRMSPSDPAFAVVNMDLLVRFGDTTPRTIAHRCTIFAEDEVAQGGGEAAHLRLVLHTDVFARHTGGRLLNNELLAKHNASYFDEALASVADSLGGVRPTPTESAEVDIAAQKRESLSEWATVDSGAGSASTRRLLRFGLEGDELDQVYGFLPAGDDLRIRYERYVAELRRAWLPSSDDELRAVGRQAIADLADLGDRFGIANWQELSSFTSSELGVVNRSDYSSSQGDLVGDGAHAFRSQLTERSWDSTRSRRYLAAANGVADGPLPLGFLVGPLVDAAGSFESAFRLWAGGGALVVEDNRVSLLRMWK